MSPALMRHVAACNQFDPAQFFPLILDGRRIGFIHRDHRPILKDHPALFSVTDRAVRFAETLKDAASRTEALDAFTETLIARGVLHHRRNEPFGITDGWGGPLLFELDRGAVPFFGTRSYGVHLNGLARDGEGQACLWIGTRAQDKKIAPGKLDNIVAGGIGSGYGAFETLVKEADEEAAMPESLTRTARAAGAVFYRMALAEGVRDDVLFVYDIHLPDDFVPHNRDGEMARFDRLTVPDVLNRVRTGDEFKFNVALVVIDFALRHGYITPEDPEFVALASGLYGGLAHFSI